MYGKILLIFFSAFVFTGCQFTETMVLNEDGSGSMSVSVNMNELMALSGGAMVDSTVMKMDTLISMKDFLVEKKDSIATLPLEEQQKLKAMEAFNIHMKIDSQNSEMLIDVFTAFENIAEVDDLLNALNQANSFIPAGAEENSAEPASPNNLIGVDYDFKNGVFSRDAFIIDEAAHKVEVDSLKSSEAFMGGMMYTLKYTFPKKIKQTSIPEAVFSLDGKTLTIEKSFVEYFKNPDVLDLTVELEK